MFQIETDMELVSRPGAEIAALIGEQNDELSALYAPDQRHGLALEALFAPHVRFFIARRGGEAVGCGGVALLPGFAEIKRMYVRRSLRGSGVADAIMAQLVAETASAGIALLRLETGVHSKAVIAFYRRRGFRDRAAFEPYAAMTPEAIATSRFREMTVEPNVSL